MSIKVMNRVWEDCSQKAESLLVMLALADWCDDDGACFPSVKSIAEKARITERAAFKIINRLEVDGEVQIKAGRGRGNRSRYILPRYGVKAERRSGISDLENLNAATIKPERGDTENLNAATSHIEEPSLGTVKEPSGSSASAGAGTNGAPVAPLPAAHTNGSTQPEPLASPGLPPFAVNGASPAAGDLGDATPPFQVEGDPSPAKPKRSARNGKAPQPPEYHALVAALAEVCRLDLATIPPSTWVKLDGAAKSLLGADVTADFVREVGTRWYSSDWRGKQGKKPTLAQLQEEIGDARIRTTRAPGHYPQYGVHDAPARVKMSEVF